MTTIKREMVARTWEKEHAGASMYNFSSGVTRRMVKNIAQRWYINCIQRAFSSRLFRTDDLTTANMQFRNCAFY